MIQILFSCFDYNPILIAFSALIRNIDIVNQQLKAGQKIFMTITGVAGTGKSNVIKSVSNVAKNPIGNQDSVLRLGTTGKSSFVISGST